MTDAPDRDPDVAALLETLEAQLADHRGLRGCIARKREALRTADIDALTAACNETQDVAGRLAALERRRIALTRRLVERHGLPAHEMPTLRRLADAVGGTGRDELRAVAERLREEVTEVRRESSIVAAAAETLGRHVTGIVQAVHGALSRVGVYERRGRLAVGTQMDHCIDLKT